MSIFTETLVFRLFLAKRVARGWGKVRRTRWQPNIVVIVLECSLFTLLFTGMPFIYLLDHLFEQLFVSFTRFSPYFPRKAADFYRAQEEHLSHGLDVIDLPAAVCPRGPCFAFLPLPFWESDGKGLSLSRGVWGQLQQYTCRQIWTKPTSK